MQGKLSYIKTKLRDNGELIFGLINILCFYAIVFSSLLNNTTYYSVSVEKGIYWADLAWKAGLSVTSIFYLMSCYKVVYLVYATIMSHGLLVFFYSGFSLLPTGVTNSFEVLSFFLWWLSLLVALRYFHLASSTGKMNRYYFTIVVLYAFELLTYLTRR